MNAPDTEHADGPETVAARSAQEPDWLWDLAPLDEQGRSLDEWMDARKARGVPSKPAMYKRGPEALLENLTPGSPLITPKSRVIAMGSCFASLFVQWLAENGFNRMFGTDGDEALVRSSLETPVVVAQFLRWAFDELSPELAFWYTAAAERYEATEERRRRLRASVENADVIILTLGLAESWFDRETGEPIWRIPPADLRADRFAVRVTGVTECVEALETIDRLLSHHAPAAKVVFTVSPVRFRATFRELPGLVANSASKAIVRAAVDEFLRAHRPETNDRYFYFPSYEIVNDFFLDPFQGDNRHVDPSYSSIVLDLFARHFTTLVSDDARPSTPESPLHELEQRLRSLEGEKESLQRVCDERLGVIEGLKQVCDDRLALIERLSAELDRLRS